MDVWRLRLVDALAWIALGIILLVKLRAIVDGCIRKGQKYERRRQKMRAIRKTIYAMTMEDLAAERKHLRAKRTRERSRGSDGLKMVEYRLRLVEARMRQLQKNAPGDAATSAQGQPNQPPAV